MLGGGRGGQKIKVDQNGVKHGLVLEFLRSDEIFEIWSEKLTGQQASKHTSGHHSDQISRSALRDGATNKNTEGRWPSARLVVVTGQQGDSNEMVLDVIS